MSCSKYEIYNLLLVYNGDGKKVVEFKKPRTFEYDKTEHYWEDLRSFNNNALEAWAMYNCARGRVIETGVDTLHCVFHIILEYDGKLEHPLDSTTRENLRINEEQRQMRKELFARVFEEEVKCWKGMNENVM